MGFSTNNCCLSLVSIWKIATIGLKSTFSLAMLRVLYILRHPVLRWFNFFKQKHDDFFSVFHLSESDANCSRSTKYVSKLVKDFLDEPSEKNSDSEVVRLPPHEGYIRGIFQHLDCFKCGCSESFFIRYKKVLRPKAVKRGAFSNA